MDSIAQRVSSLFAHTYVIFGCALFNVGWCVAIYFGVVGDKANIIYNLILSFITLLVAMLLQKTQTADTKAIQAKLDELIRSSAARDAFIGIEKLPRFNAEEIT